MLDVSIKENQQHIDHPSNHRRTRQLRDRTYKGIPDSVRGAAWASFLRVESVKQPGVYEVRVFLR